MLHRVRGVAEEGHANILIHVAPELRIGEFYRLGMIIAAKIAAITSHFSR